MRQRLTDETIAGFGPTRKDRWVGDTDVRGLRIRVTPAGVKTWSQVYRSGGRIRTLSLGHWPEVTVGEARSLAAEARRKLRHGEDPQELAVSRLAGMTVGDLLDAFVKAKGADVAPKTLLGYGTYRRTMKHLLSRPVATLKRGDLADGLARIKAPVAANRCLAHLRAAFRWAISVDLIERDPTMGVRMPHREGARERVLTDEEITILVRALDAERWRVRMAVLLMLLLGQRVAETMSMDWSEIEIDFKPAPEVMVGVWRIPAKKRKTRTGNVVPIPAEVLAMMLDAHAQRPRGTGGKPQGPIIGLSVGARWQWLKRVQRNVEKVGCEPLQLRDLRRTCATGVSRLGAAPHIASRILGHAEQGVTRKVYDRFRGLDDVRIALTRWAQHVQTLGWKEVAR